LRPTPHAARLLVLVLFTLAGRGLLGQQRPETAQVLRLPQRQIDSTNLATAPIGDAERSALTFTRYDLDVHLRPDTAAISVLARVTVRNDGDTPLPEIALQVSSLLRWDRVSQVQGQRAEKVSFQQHLLETDADHTGKASETVVHLLQPLAVHATADLNLLYSGQIRGSVGALEGEIVSSSRGALSDWGTISQNGTYLRGFGRVLWYPVASPQVFLGEGANLLQVTGQQMLHQAGAEVRLRISVEYTGDAPGAVFFCGREQPLTGSRDNPEVPVADSPGVATAEFPPQELGFRTLSLLVTGDPVPVSGSALAFVSRESGLGERLSSASAPVSALLQEWFGPGAVRRLTVVDHSGGSFVDTGLLVAPVSGADGETLTAELVPSMTRARFQSSHAWLDYGMAQFVSLLWLERTRGRPAVVAALTEASHAIALAESVGPSSTDPERSLLRPEDAVFYQSKAASVLWMLRGVVGDTAMKQAFQRYVRDPRMDRDPAGLQKLLEEVSGKSLGWFFEDWVYHDRGLPDLSVLGASSRPLPSKTASGAGRLVAVEVRNDGGAAAEVPVTVRSGSLTATERLRIDAHSVASVRVLFQGEPEEVQVNDGTVPEMISGTHIREIPPS